MRWLSTLLFCHALAQYDVWEHDKGYDGYTPALLNVAEVLVRDLILKGAVKPVTAEPEPIDEHQDEHKEDKEADPVPPADPPKPKPTTWYKRLWAHIKKMM